MAAIAAGTNAPPICARSHRRSPLTATRVDIASSYA